MLRVLAYYKAGSKRAEHLASAMAEGIRLVGDIAEATPREDDAVAADVAVFYGWKRPDLAAAYRKAGQSFVYLDLGYWHRKPSGDIWSGFHKVVVNARDPIAYFRRGHSDRRLREFGIRTRPWRADGRHVVIAGMSGKAAPTYGLAAEEWERRAAKELRANTKRPLMYRPKPSWAEAGRIDGCEHAGAQLQLEAVLSGAWALVTHHSNAAVDALVRGVPIFCEHGAPSLLSMRSLAEIDSPRLPDDREAFLADLAWTQFSVAEMRAGFVWRHLRNEGLI